jgi:Putative Actinobacterial Holin-X, holin superfamily III
MAIVEGGNLRQRPTLELVRDLAHQTSTLVHQEVELVKVEVKENIDLAKDELTEKGRKAGVGVGVLAAAGGLALVALGALTAFLILALDGAMPSWLAALCVAVLWGVVATLLALYGRRKLEEVGTPVPERTIGSVKEDVAWLKDQMN